jgi:hypothetical protein
MPLIAWPSDGSSRRLWATISASLQMPSPTPQISAFANRQSPHVGLQHRSGGTRLLPPSESFYSASSKRMIQRIIAATSTCTIVLVLVTFFFFCRMKQKRLRHKLVMLSILGCFIRGLWYFIFSSVVISGTVIRTTSGLCQATGFFIHVGNEMSGAFCDAAPSASYANCA